jgi:acetyl-CoA carboxylase biotin carboxyl carrier protein
LRKDAAMAQKDSDLRKIKELIEIMKDNDLLEVEIKHGDDKIFLKRCQPQQPPVTAVPVIGSNISAAPLGPNAAQTSAAGAIPLVPQPEEHLLEIKSSIVGTYYAAPSPDSEPYVELGSQVSPQTVVCIIEAMKVMNEIKAETSGTIAEVLVTNGQAIEYGQVLFKVKPD